MSERESLTNAEVALAAAGSEASPLETNLDAALVGTAGGTLEEKLDRALEQGDTSASGGILAVAMPRRPAAYLVIVRGDLAGKTLPLLAEPPWTLGRSEAATLTLHSKAVSLEHARIEQDGDRFRLRDLDSTNGTLLNGRAVKRPVFLRVGDTIEIADTASVFVTRDTDEINGTVPIHASGLARRSEGPDAPFDWRPPQGIVQQSASTTAPTRWAGDRGAWGGEDGEDAERGPSLVDFLKKLFQVLALMRRHWRKLLVLPTICGALGLTSLVLQQPPSEVEFELGIHWQEPENPLENGRPVQSREELQQFHTAALESFADPRLVRSTFQRTGTPDPSDALVRATAQKLELRRVREGVFRGTVQTREPEVTIRFLSRHLDGYVQSEVQKTLRVTQSQIDFLSRQVEEQDAVLLRTERELRDFKSKHLLELPENASARLASAGELQSRSGVLGAEVVRLQGDLRLAEAQLTRESPLIEAKVAEAAPYRQSLADANRRLTQARARGLGPDHPEIQQLEREVAPLERRADEAARSVTTDLDRQANPAYTQLKDRVGSLRVQLAAANQELGSVGGQLGSISRTAAVMPQVEAEHVRLARTYETDKTLHTRLIERLRQVEVQRDLDRASAEARYDVITPPRSLGVQLRKALAIRSGSGVALGLLIALVLGAIQEFRRLVRNSPELQTLAKQHASVSEPKD